MVEQLGEIGKLLSGISTAVKTMKSLQDENSQLFKVIEQAKKRAGEVEALYLPNEPLLEELKLELRKVRDSGSKLEDWLKTFKKEIAELDSFLIDKIEGSSIPREVIKDLCKMLQKANKSVTNFSKAFSNFISHLVKSQELATQIADNLRQRADQLDKQANNTRKWGAAKTAGYVIAGVGAGAGIAALIFFTGGIAFLPLAVSSGVAVGAAGGIMASKTHHEAVMDVNAMRNMASGIQGNSNKLVAIARNLESVCDTAGSIQLDKEALEALQIALALLKSDMEKNEEMAAKDAEMAAKDAEMAAKDTEMAAKDAEMAAKDVELAAMKAKLRMHGIESE